MSEREHDDCHVAGSDTWEQAGARKRARQGPDAWLDAALSAQDELEFTERASANMCAYIGQLSLTEFSETFWDVQDDSVAQKLNECYRHTISLCHEFLQNRDPDDRDCCVLRRAYRYAKGAARAGRIYVHGCGVQRLQKRVRGALVNSYCHDVDMVNCHPTLLLHLCKLHGWPCTALTRYVRRRSELLDNGDLTKKDVLCCMNSDTRISTKNPFLVQLDCECKVLQAHIVEHEPFRKALGDSRGRNPRGSFLNRILCVLENHVLQQALTHVRTKFKVGVATPMFDGFHVDARDTRGGVIDAEEVAQSLTALTEPIYGIQWATKPHHSGVTVPHDFKPQAVCASDNHAAQALVQVWQGRKFVRGATGIYMLEDGVWLSEVDDAKRIDSAIRNLVSDSGLRAPSAPGGRVNPIGLTDSHRRAVAAMFKDRLPFDGGFEERLWESSLGHVFFRNGVYRFSDGVFKPFGDPALVNVHSTFKIQRDYPECVDGSVCAEVRRRIFDAIFDGGDGVENETGEALRCFLARGLAGEYTEKIFGIGIGVRNSGKSKLIKAMQRAFGPYIATTHGDNLLAKDTSGESDRALTWAIPLATKRITFMSEINMICGSGQSRNVVSGDMIKRLSSGGDELSARRLYSQARPFRLQTRFLLMCNDLPAIEPEDARQSVVKYTFPVEFTCGAPVGTRGLQRVGDDTIDDFISRPDAIDAFTRIILESYRPVPILPPGGCECEGGDDDDLEATQIDELLHVGEPGPRNGQRPFVQMQELVKRFKGKISRMRLVMLLERRGCTKGRHLCSTFKKGSCTHTEVETGPIDPHKNESVMFGCWFKVSSCWQTPSRQTS